MVMLKKRLSKRVRSILNNMKQKVLNSPVGRLIKKSAITLVGSLITLIGVIFIVLPGPAFLLIPVGLGLLSLEYQFARIWLRKFQKWLSKSAAKADDLIARKRRKASAKLRVSAKN